MTSQPIISGDVVSRQWPVTVKHYWFDQRPAGTAMPDIAKLHSIPAPLKNARNNESWTLLIDLSATETELMSRLSSNTRTQVRRAEREGISIERLNCREAGRLDEFAHFWSRFSESKADVRSILNISVQLHMLQRMANASILELSRAVGPAGEILAYHVIIVAGERARVHHSASLFRIEGLNSAQRHLIGRANRFLRWQNILYYKRYGFTQFDMGGWYAGNEDDSLLRVNAFKEEFGGQPVCEYDAMIACTMIGRWALAVQELLRKGLHGRHPKTME